MMFLRGFGPAKHAATHPRNSLFFRTGVKDDEEGVVNFVDEYALLYSAKLFSPLVSACTNEH